MSGISIVGTGHTMSADHFSPTDRPTHNLAKKNWNGNSCKRSYITKDKSRRVSSPKNVKTTNINAMFAVDIFFSTSISTFVGERSLHVVRHRNDISRIEYTDFEVFNATNLLLRKQK